MASIESPEVSVAEREYGIVVSMKSNAKPPSVLAVRQDLEVLTGRPQKQCYSLQSTKSPGQSIPINNYANVVAVLFSKPMTQETANVPSA